jgi:hypothetical protein
VRGELSLGETVRSAIEGLSNAGKAALEELAATAGAREAEASEERKQLAKTLRSKELDATRKDKALAADLDAARNAVAEEDRRAGERAAALEQAKAEWTEELEALKGLVG